MAAGVASCGAEEKPREAEGEDCNYWLENPLAWPGISRDAFGDFYCHAGRCVCVCVCGKTCQSVACGLLNNLNQPKTLDF